MTPATSIFHPHTPSVAPFVSLQVDEFNACLDAFEAKLLSREPIDLHAIEAFLADVKRIGLWAPVVSGTLQTTDLQMSLAYCHIASFPAGQAYLMHVAGAFPVEIGQRSLLVLQSLTPQAREEMLRQVALGSWSTRIGVDGLVLLTIPGTRLRFPLMPACVSDEGEGITTHEMRQLLDAHSPSGCPLRQTLLALHSRMSREQLQELSAWHTEQGDRYGVSELPALAAAQYSKACVAALDANDWPRTLPLVRHFLHCLGECTNAHAAALLQGELIGAFERHGFHATAAETAWGLADQIHDRFGPPEAACAMRALAQRLWARAGGASGQHDPDARKRDLDRGIREVIGAHANALASAGLNHSSDSIRCDGMIDIYSLTAFDPSDEQEWCLMRRTSKWQAGRGIWDLILEETAASIRKGGTHPWTHGPICQEDVIRGSMTLDLLRLASGVEARTQAGIAGGGGRVAYAHDDFTWLIKSKIAMQQ